VILHYFCGFMECYKRISRLISRVLFIQKDYFSELYLDEEKLCKLVKISDIRRILDVDVISDIFFVELQRKLLHS
jgi:hypothetical protein